MAVSDREWIVMQRTVERHDDELRALQISKAETSGAAKEGARYGARLVVIASILGIVAQGLIAFLGH